MSNFMGFEFIWFYACVENNIDPLQLGRCQIRILGFHDPDKQQKLPTEDLPWATLSIPVSSKFKIDPPRKGTFVWGFYTDGQQMQKPTICFMLPTIPQKSAEDNSNKGFFDSADDLESRPKPPENLTYKTDGSEIEIEEGTAQGFPAKTEKYLVQGLDEPVTPRSAREDDNRESNSTVEKRKEWAEQVTDISTAVGGETWSETESPYDAKYPYNEVVITPSGHSVEFDDNGAERILIQHRAGTFLEIHPNGAQVEKIMADSEEIVSKDKKVIIFNNYYMTSKNDIRELSKNKYEESEEQKQEIVGTNKTESVGENRTEVVGGNHSETVTGTHTESSSGNMTKTAPIIKLN